MRYQEDSVLSDQPRARVGRGAFLAWTGAGTAALAAGCAPGSGSSAASPQPSDSAGPAYGTLKFFTSSEAETIVAMAERIFPADANGPGATDLHVVDFLDGQLSGQYGWAAKTYMQGPWTQPTSKGHGWQFPALPRDIYRQAIASVDAYAQKNHQNPFNSITADQQDSALHLMQTGKMTTFTGAVASDAFFSMFLADVTRGLFTDPMYGGNRNAQGWVFLGFPGDPMAYGDQYAAWVDQYDSPYTVAAMAIGQRSANPPAAPANQHVASFSDRPSASASAPPAAAASPTESPT
jgi:gluconate 2-dehydrogenase gamma chain